MPRCGCFLVIALRTAVFHISKYVAGSGQASMHNETAAAGQQAPSRAQAMCPVAGGDADARVGGSGPDEVPVQQSRSTVRTESEGEGAGEERGQVGGSRNGASKRKRDKAETAQDALLPHEPLARVMRRALKPTTHLERAAVQTVQVSSRVDHAVSPLEKLYCWSKNFDCLNGCPVARDFNHSLVRDLLALHSRIVSQCQKCVSELVMVVVGEATEHCLATGRRSLSSQDILWALRELGI